MERLVVVALIQALLTKLVQTLLAGNAARRYLCAMNGPLDFSGKVALVTGSSRGIGAAITTALGRRGAQCVVNYVADPEGRNLADAQAVTATLKDAVVVQCDVSDAAQAGDMMATVRKKFGGVDFLDKKTGVLPPLTLQRKFQAQGRNGVS